MSATSRFSFGEAMIGDWRGAGLVKESVLKTVVTTIDQGLVIRVRGTYRRPIPRGRARSSQVYSGDLDSQTAHHANHTKEAARQRRSRDEGQALTTAQPAGYAAAVRTTFASRIGRLHTAAAAASAASAYHIHR